MKDSVKYGILGLLAVGLIINGIYLFTKGKSYSSKPKAELISQNNANTAAAAAAAVNNSNPTTAQNQTPNNQTPNNQPQNANPTTPEQPGAESEARPRTSLNWSSKEYDFGDIKQDSENEHVFKFTNTGDEPLIIEDAKGSCGCTVPEFPKQPIPPGGTDEIRVVYKPGKQKNNQTKKVTVTANTDPVQTILTIKANVEVPPEG